MPADYDFVIIGYSIAGVRAAVQAARAKARVVLVAQNCQPSFQCHRVLATLAQSLQQVARSGQFLESKIESIALRSHDVNRWIDTIAQTQQEFYDPAKLATLGIEFIAASGEFCRKPPGFVVNGRVLRSRSYLIATHYTPVVPEIAGIETIRYLTPETISAEVPDSLVIIGDDAIGAELAQVYARLGAQVTLILRQPHVFAIADAEAAFVIQATLEAEGVRIINALHIQQIRQVRGQTQIEIENYTIVADEVLIAAGWEPEISRLNLEAMGIQDPVRLNDRLQTMHPRVHWIAHPIDTIALVQADTVVNNIISLPIFKVDYDRIAQSVVTSPEFAWIGLTETQALRRYRRDVVVLRQSFNTVTKAQISGLTGLCKIVVRRSGQIVGAHIVGANASELISTIALAMQQNLKIQSFEHLQIPALAFSEVLVQAAQQWRINQQQGLLQDLRESYLAWQRSRTS